MYNIECLRPITHAPEIRISYKGMAGPNHLTLKLPVHMSKFIVPVEMTNTEFFGRWRQIGGPPKESQIVFKHPTPIDLAVIKNALTTIKVANLENMDPNPKNMCGALVFNCTELGRVGGLLRIEPNVEQQVSCSR